MRRVLSMGLAGLVLCLAAPRADGAQQSAAAQAKAGESAADRAPAEALAHLEANRPNEAIALLKPYVESHADDYAARFNLALAHSMAGQDSEAIAEYGKVIAQKPDLFEAQMNLGQLLVKTLRFAEAEATLQKAATMKPGDGRVPFLLSRAYSGQKKWREAAERMSAASAASPDDREMKLELADLYERAGMKAEAAQAWRNAGDDPAALERLGLLQLEAQDYEAAIASFESAMKKGPTPAVAFALASAYLRNKQPEKSVPLAQWIVEKDPQNVEARLFYARLLRDQKNYPEAARQFQQVVRLKPDSAEGWNEFTAMLMLLHQYEPALQALERAKALGGETPAYFYLKGVMLDSLKLYKPALESYERFLELSQDRSPDEEFKARQRVRMLKKMVKR